MSAATNKSDRSHRDDRADEGGRAEIVFILDASGSMGGLEDDTVGGFNSLVDKNREEPGEATVSTILFSSESRVLHDRIDIREVPRLTRRDYRCYGGTALLDAVGSAIRHVDLVQRVLPAGLRADRVLFVITTDGMENMSRRFTYRQVKRMIEERREEGWEFLFIGANIDAAAEAGRLGIAADRAAGYVADARGTEVLYEAMSAAVASARCCAPGVTFDDGWRRGLDQDRRRAR